MKDDIIRMAREAGIPVFPDQIHGISLTSIERFYNLAVQHERERIYFQTSSDFVKEALAKEREWIINLLDTKYSWTPYRKVEEIRARGEKQ